MGKRLLQSLLILASVSMLSFGAHASVEDGCETLHATDAVTIELCRKAMGPQDVARITVDGDNHHDTSSTATVQQTVINARYPVTTGKRRMWDRLWVSSAHESLTNEAQDELRTIFEAAPAALEKEGLLPLLDVLSNMIEPNQAIEPFEKLKRVSPNWFGRTGYTMICDFLEKPHDAYFSAYGEGVVKTLIVGGGQDNNCRGRCGWGCLAIAQHHANQYTQECLNHDACRDATGQQFGECRDEFWAAAEGYVMAPDCF